jgi:hypothetical protein
LSRSPGASFNRAVAITRQRETPIDPEFGEERAQDVLIAFDEKAGRSQVGSFVSFVGQERNRDLSTTMLPALPWPEAHVKVQSVWSTAVKDSIAL